MDVPLGLWNGLNGLANLLPGLHQRALDEELQVGLGQIPKGFQIHKHSQSKGNDRETRILY